MKLTYLSLNELSKFSSLRLQVSENKLKYFCWILCQRNCSSSIMADVLFIRYDHEFHLGNLAIHFQKE